MTLKYTYFVCCFSCYCNAIIVISFTERGASVITPYHHILLPKNFNVLQVQFCNRCNIAPALRQNGNGARQTFFTFPSSAHLMVQASLMHVPIHSACNLICFIVIQLCNVRVQCILQMLKWPVWSH